jgi:hypothetical protein
MVMESPSNDKLEKLLLEALGTPPDSSELPDPVLNSRLKAKLYQIQDKKQAEKNRPVRKISLWYLPALLNIIGNLAFSLAAAALSNGILNTLVMGIAAYTSLGGVALTIVGVRCASLKDKLTLVLYPYTENSHI